MFERMVQQQLEILRKERNKESVPNAAVSSVSIIAPTVADEKQIPTSIPGQPAAQSNVNNIPTPTESVIPTPSPDDQVPVLCT